MRRRRSLTFNVSLPICTQRSNGSRVRPGISIEQFIVTAVIERLAAREDARLDQRARRSSKEAFEWAPDVRPGAGDEL